MSVYFDYNYGISNQEDYFISGLSIIYLVISIITLSGFFYIKYKILGDINKRYLFITIGLFIVVILFPIKFVFKDGGTKVYQSMIYKVIYWNRLNDNYLDGFKTGREIHLFPFNFWLYLTRTFDLQFDIAYSRRTQISPIHCIISQTIIKCNRNSKKVMKKMKRRIVK